MAEIKEEHFEVIDSNRAKAYEEQKINASGVGKVD
jgi:hypothetical protein